MRLIDADAVKKKLYKEFNPNLTGDDLEIAKITLDIQLDCINAAPTVEKPYVHHANWEPTTIKYIWGKERTSYHCSECHWPGCIRHSYCSMCGAKMDNSVGLFGDAEEE